MNSHSQTLVNNEIAEITTKIEALDAIRAKLEQNLLKLQEEELELDDECEHLLALSIQPAFHPALQWKESGSVWSLRIPRTSPNRVRVAIYLRAPDEGGDLRSCPQSTTNYPPVSHSW